MCSSKWAPQAHHMTVPSKPALAYFESYSRKVVDIWRKFLKVVLASGEAGILFRLSLKNVCTVDVYKYLNGVCNGKSSRIWYDNSAFGFFILKFFWDLPFTVYLQAFKYHTVRIRSCLGCPVLFYVLSNPLWLVVNPILYDSGSESYKYHTV